MAMLKCLHLGYHFGYKEGVSFMCEHNKSLQPMERIKGSDPLISRVRPEPAAHRTAAAQPPVAPRLPGEPRGR